MPPVPLPLYYMAGSPPKGSPVARTHGVLSTRTVGSQDTEAAEKVPADVAGAAPAEGVALCGGRTPSRW